MRWIMPLVLVLLPQIGWAETPFPAAEICVRRYALHYHVPPEFIDALIDVESRWNPQAVSNKGAMGLMQLMPGRPQPNLATRLSFSRFRPDAQLTWRTAPGGPQAVRVLFIGSEAILVRLIGETPRIDCSARRQEPRRAVIGHDAICQSCFGRVSSRTRFRSG
jgi:Transglycosylase SLT domain